MGRPSSVRARTLPIPRVSSNPSRSLGFLRCSFGSVFVTPELLLAGVFFGLLAKRASISAAAALFVFLEDTDDTPADDFRSRLPITNGDQSEWGKSRGPQARWLEIKGALVLMERSHCPDPWFYTMCGIVTVVCLVAFTDVLRPGRFGRYGIGTVCRLVRPMPWISKLFCTEFLQERIQHKPSKPPDSMLGVGIKKWHWRPSVMQFLVFLFRQIVQSD